MDWSIPLITLVGLGIVGFVLKNGAQLTSTRIIGALLMGPAFAWLSGAAVDAVVPRLGWGVWVFVIGVLAFVLSSGKTVLTIYNLLLLASYPLLTRMISQSPLLAGIRLPFGGPDMPALVVITVLFWIASIWEATREED